MDRPGFTILKPEILTSIINPMGFTNAFMLFSPHGEVIYDTLPIENDPVLAMCYSAPPLTVNYSREEENKRVLQIVDDNSYHSLRNRSFSIHTTRRRNGTVVAFAPEHRASQARKHNSDHFKTIVALDPGNPYSIHKELISLASAIKRGDVVHEKSISSIRSVKPSKVTDSHKSFLFSQSFPVTKMITGNGDIIPLRSIEHPNKRYTLRADDDIIPEIASGNFEYKINLVIQNPFYKKERTGISGITTTYNSRRSAAGTTTSLKTHIERRAAANGSSIAFQEYIESLAQEPKIIVVTRENCHTHRHIIGNVVGMYVELILGENSEILKFWKGVILIPVQSRGTSREVVSYYMLPYRFRKLSGIHCVVFDLWHILSYISQKSEYSVRGLTMTTTRDYMNLLRMIGIQLVVGVDLTCNVPGTENGAWPLLTYDLIIKNLRFQELFFQNIGNARMHSARLNPTYDLLPQFLHASTELNTFLDEIKKASTVHQILESIHGMGRLVPRRGRKFSSNDTESYIALYEYVRRLCGDIRRGETCINERENLVIKKKVGNGPEEVMSHEEVCHLQQLVVPLRSVTHDSIAMLKTYLRENNISFSIHPSKMRLLRDAFPLHGTDDVPASHEAVYNQRFRLWAVPSLKYADHLGVPCFYHTNLDNAYADKFKTNITTDVMIEELRNAKKESQETFGNKYTIVGFLYRGTFKPFNYFENWWDLYKEQHRLMLEGGDRKIKTKSKTRKRLII